ncbi:hypothetical protein PEBR_21973 [Penicillium brasilianum]|uniref:Uncharacterized protein n=1 Tax=Penicillium brasilianum TaxID=104259 RepID=A0A1S9RMU2_PENBI|nr:hypothetical protein PEBR_21973 [Penicillium brasilianum]
MDHSYTAPAYCLLLPPLFNEDPRRGVKWSPESWWAGEVLKELKRSNLTVPNFKRWREIVTNKLDEWTQKCQWIETNVKDFSKNHFRIESEQIVYFLQHAIAGKLSRFRPSLKVEYGCYISPCFDKRRRAVVEACYGLARQVEMECERQNVMVEPSAHFGENLCMLSVAIGRLSLEGLNVDCPDVVAINKHD